MTPVGIELVGNEVDFGRVFWSSTRLCLGLLFSNLVWLLKAFVVLICLGFGFSWKAEEERWPRGEARRGRTNFFALTSSSCAVLLILSVVALAVSSVPFGGRGATGEMNGRTAGCGP